MTEGPLGVACGNCGGNLLMATCHHFRGTGHEWVLVSICMVCRAVHWVEEGCLDCKRTEGPASILPDVAAQATPPGSLRAALPRRSSCGS